MHLQRMAQVGEPYHRRNTSILCVNNASEVLQHLFQRIVAFHGFAGVAVVIPVEIIRICQNGIRNGIGKVDVLDQPHVH